MIPMPVARTTGRVLWSGLGVAPVALWSLVAALAIACGGRAGWAAEPDGPPAVSHAERMAKMGLTRYRGAWRTAQEIELIERNEATNVAEKQWVVRLGRLRQQLDKPATAADAAEELRGIDDPLAVPALAGGIGAEQVFQVRGWYLEALARIGTPAAIQSLVGIALDHPDRETRIAAVERLRVLGTHHAVPTLVAALASADSAQVNRAAEALGRLEEQSAVLPLINALETRHVVVTPGAPAGTTSATFAPNGGGGLSAGGGGPKQQLVVSRNEQVLEALRLLTGTNFEWDAAAWRAWFVRERGLPADFDPRRG